MGNRFVKLGDEWGVALQHPADPGQKVKIVKANGSTSVVTLGRKVSGTSSAGIWTIGREESAGSARRGDNSRLCANCGEPTRGRTFARVDSSGIRGLVCSTCSRESAYALSFG